MTEENDKATEGQVSDASQQPQVGQTTTATKPPVGSTALDVDGMADALRKTRDENAARRKENKELLERLAAFEAKQRAEEDAKLSEQEKTQKQAAELAKKLSEYETRVAEAEAKSRALALRTAIVEAAPKAGIAHPVAAVKLLDTTTLALGDDGTPQNLDTALKNLLKEYPFLGGAPQVGATNPSRSESSPGATAETREREMRAKIYGNPASMFNLDRAKSTGGGVIDRNDDQ